MARIDSASCPIRHRILASSFAPSMTSTSPGNLPHPRATLTRQREPVPVGTDPGLGSVHRWIRAPAPHLPARSALGAVQVVDSLVVGLDPLDDRILVHGYAAHGAQRLVALRIRAILE